MNIDCKCLSIAGFDGSGGAGIQADLKTFSAFGCYGMTVLTALPIQNTCGVRKCYEIPLSAILEQLEAIFDDITPNAIKIGMLFNSNIIEVVANFLKKYAEGIPIVLDPIMLAKSGDHLLLPEAIDALKTLLIPIATVITPNIPEAIELIGYSNDQLDIGEKILALGAKSAVIKGGHLQGKNSNDLFISKDINLWLESPRVNSNNTHGTGCTFSAAIASCLAMGMELSDACLTAKRYIYQAIKTGEYLEIGKGKGPVNHLCNMERVLEKI